MAVSNSLATRASGGGQRQTFSAYITSDAIRKKVNEMVGGKNGDRFITSMISAVSTNPALANCDSSTILSAALLGESLKLSPSPQLGQYYLVPFDDNKNGRKVATFQLGYKGYIQLAIRSGNYKKLNVLAIKEGEMVRYDPLDEEFEANIIQDAEAREMALTVGYYAMFEYTNGFRKTMYWPKGKMESHAERYSQGYAADKRKGTKWTFWSKDFDAMALKTMLRQLISKWGVMSIEMQQAFESDMTFRDEQGHSEYVESSEDFIDLPAEDSAPAPAAEVVVEAVNQEQSADQSGNDKPKNNNRLAGPPKNLKQPDWMQ